MDEKCGGLRVRAAEDAALCMLSEGERTARLSFSSEAPVRRGNSFETLSHAAGAVMLERLNSTGCLLYNHNRDRVIGKILKAEIRNGRGEAVVRFDEDAESDVIFNKVKNGTLRGVSVGYIVHKTTRRAAKEGKEEYIAKLWEPVEISIVSVPADISVGVGRAAGRGVITLSAARRRTRINSNLFNSQLKIKNLN